MELKLTVEKREKNEKLGNDFIPAVLYGKDVENRSLKLKKLDFEKIFNVAGESNLIELSEDGKSVKVLVKDIQRDVLKHTFTHVDFLQVNMKEKILATIPLHFVGESKAIKELNGSLMREVNEIEVECLPGDLVDHIDVDISVLVSFDEVIKINDLKIPAGLKLMHLTNDVVAVVAIPKAQVEETPVVAETVVDPKAPVDPKAAAAAEGKDAKK
ncbi:MAG: 50S ribosomal protein L25 [Patescibacteria group bacterium]